MDQQHLDHWFQKRRERKENRSVDRMFERLKSGNREALSSSITLLESTLQEDHQFASDLIQKCLPFTGKSMRVGITGVPGVGKSTFIESFGKQLVKLGKKVAILAIDPSSS